MPPQLAGYRHVRELWPDCHEYVVARQGRGNAICAEPRVTVMHLHREIGAEVMARFAQRRLPHVVRPLAAVKGLVVLPYFSVRVSERMRDKAIAPATALLWFTQLAEALVSLHAQSIVHGEVSAATLVTRDDAQVLLMPSAANDLVAADDLYGFGMFARKLWQQVNPVGLDEVGQALYDLAHECCDLPPELRPSAIAVAARLHTIAHTSRGALETYARERLIVTHNAPMRERASLIPEPPLPRGAASFDEYVVASAATDALLSPRSFDTGLVAGAETDLEGSRASVLGTAADADDAGSVPGSVPGSALASVPGAAGDTQAGTLSTGGVSRLSRRVSANRQNRSQNSGRASVSGRGSQAPRASGLTNRTSPARLSLSGRATRTGGVTPLRRNARVALGMAALASVACVGLAYTPLGSQITGGMTGSRAAMPPAIAAPISSGPNILGTDAQTIKTALIGLARERDFGLAAGKVPEGLNVVGSHSERADNALLARLGGARIEGFESQLHAIDVTYFGEVPRSAQQWLGTSVIPTGGARWAQADATLGVSGYQLVQGKATKSVSPSSVRVTFYLFQASNNAAWQIAGVMRT